MADFKQTFQDEVRRLARKELKALDEKINEQRKTINALQKRVNELEKKQAAPAANNPAAAEKKQDAPAQEKGRKVRFSPRSIQKLRKKYGLSQKALAKLLDVTPFTVSHWEIGKNRPRGNQIEAISAMMKLGKRKMNALVAEKAPEELPAQKPAAGKKTAAPAKRGRKPAADKAPVAAKKAGKAAKAPAKKAGKVVKAKSPAPAAPVQKA